MARADLLEVSNGMFSGKTESEHQDTDIINDGFWPDINAGDFEKRRSVPVDMDKDAIAMSVVSAIAQINIELVGVKTRHEAEGIAQASDVISQPSIADKNMLVILYEKAVYARAKAELLPEFATTQMRDAGENVTQREPETRDSLFAESLQHIRTIKGKRSAGVELL
ncbi:head completion/stabilization protein [Moritella yayanosii]|uniref:Putative head completion/stabilization protein n=1 Tax=Moritella yayanosii TaxID=69539 RepID=A0A330LUK5_9GAMM|nr:head completion/stabilization protein [Moritella yayanosii]SQD80439.1 putative head completion/stabilization protein [Moritella yayanosii]